MKELQPPEAMRQYEVVIYQPTENIILEVRVAENTVWLSQAQMSMLFAVKENTITYHIKEIYKVQELSPDSTTRKIRVVRQEGNRSVGRFIDFYNLDMILSIGYRVNSVCGIQFRHWATNVLKEYMFKGYALNPLLIRIEQDIAKHDSQIQLAISTHYYFNHKQSSRQVFTYRSQKPISLRRLFQRFGQKIVFGITD